MEESITLSELLAAVIRGWKKVLAAMLVFAVLLGGFQAYRQIKASRAPENSPEEIENRYQTAVNTYNIQKENLEVSLKDKQNELGSEQEYINHSLLMKLDPYDEYVTYIHLAISDLDESAFQQVFRQQDTPIDYLISKIQSQYLVVWQILDLADALDLPGGPEAESKYLQEVVTLERTDGSMLKITGYGTSARDSEKLADAAYNCLLAQQDAVIDGSYPHRFSVVNRTTKSIVNLSLRDTQKTHLDSVETLTTSIENLQKQLDELAAPEREAGFSTATMVKSVIKYVIAGAVGGAFLACFCIFVMAIFSSRAASSFQLERLLSVPYLGTGTVPGRMERLADYVIGERTWKTRETAASYVVEQAKALLPAGCRVLILSTLREDQAGEDLSTLQAAIAAAGYSVHTVYDAAHNPKTAEQILQYEQILLAEAVRRSSLIDIRGVLAQVRLYKKDAAGFVMV